MGFHPPPPPPPPLFWTMLKKSARLVGDGDGAESSRKIFPVSKITSTTVVISSRHLDFLLACQHFSQHFSKLLATFITFWQSFQTVANFSLFWESLATFGNFLATFAFDVTISPCNQAILSSCHLFKFSSYHLVICQFDSFWICQLVNLSAC